MVLRLQTLLFFSLFFLGFFTQAQAQALHSNYYVEGESIRLSDIVANPKNDPQIYKFDYTKNIKRVKSDDLLRLLKKHGYHNYTSQHHYVQFTKKSPIDTTEIEESLKKHYRSKYKSIRIKSLHVAPRTYTQRLPQEYTFGIAKRSHLASEGHCYIITPDKKKIFFDYSIEASLSLYFSRETIERGSELDALNTEKKSIMLQRFSAMPLEEIDEHSLEAKRKIRAKRLITSRDVQKLYMVKRGETISVSLKNSGISISFSAKALESGREGETIRVLGNNAKELRVRVTGKNRGEI